MPAWVMIMKAVSLKLPVQLVGNSMKSLFLHPSDCSLLTEHAAMGMDLLGAWESCQSLVSFMSIRVSFLPLGVNVSIQRSWLLSA